MIRLITSIVFLLVVEVISRPQTELNISETDDNKIDIREVIQEKVNSSLSATHPLFTTSQGDDTTTEIQRFSAKTTPSVSITTTLNPEKKTTTRRTFLSSFFNRAKDLLAQIIDSSTPAGIEKPSTPSTFDTKELTTPYYYSVITTDSSIPGGFETSSPSLKLDTEELTTPFEYLVVETDLSTPIFFETPTSLPDELTTPFDYSVITTDYPKFQIETTAEYDDLTDSETKHSNDEILYLSKSITNIPELTVIEDTDSPATDRDVFSLTNNTDIDPSSIQEKTISLINNKDLYSLAIDEDINSLLNNKGIGPLAIDEDTLFFINDKDLDSLAIDEDTTLFINNKDIGALDIDEDIISLINNKYIESLAKDEYIINGKEISSLDLDYEIISHINNKDIGASTMDEDKFSLVKNKEVGYLATDEDVISIINTLDIDETELKETSSDPSTINNKDIDTKDMKNSENLLSNDKEIGLLHLDEENISFINNKDIGALAVDEDEFSYVHNEEVGTLDEDVTSLINNTDIDSSGIYEDINDLIDNIDIDENGMKETISEPNTIPDLTTLKTTSFTNTLTDKVIYDKTTDLAFKRLDNIITDIVNPIPIQIEELVQIELKITVQPGDRAVYREGSVLGLSCDANSPVDNQIDFSWTKNGRFVEINSGHSFSESADNGNIIIYNMGLDDEGLYQCVASNSEGVVFSRVIKVRMRNSVVSGASTRGQAARSLGEEDKVTVVLPFGEKGKDNLRNGPIQVVMAQTTK